MVTAAEFDQCFNASFIQLTFANFIVALFIFSRIGRGRAINVLYLRALLDILIQIPMIYTCVNPTDNYGVSALWKTFDYLKTVLFPMTAMYTILLIPPQSKVGKYKKHMVIGTYFVWGIFWLTGLSLEARCDFEKVCDLVGPKVPRQLMGFAYLSIVLADTLFSITSILEYVETQSTTSVIVQQFCKNKLFRVFCINLTGLVFYSILTYGKMDVLGGGEETIGGQYIYRLLDSYGNFMLTLYLVEYILSKMELARVEATPLHSATVKNDGKAGGASTLHAPQKTNVATVATMQTSSFDP
ncbi:hypothetical protein BKA69DRAFT_1036143 [Paraphysoderma sedebokerense]|nr:hypothetical protein BKA69DRAFT_1036143 [Paraphysoderma sedebokerense]